MSDKNAAIEQLDRAAAAMNIVIEGLLLNKQVWLRASYQKTILDVAAQVKAELAEQV